MNMNYDFHDFSETEYKQRYQRARTLMKEAGLGGLLVSEECNYRYFTGHMPPTKNRPTAFILPLDGPPLILAASYAAQSAKQMSWVQEILEYKVPLGWQSIKQAMVHLDLGGKNVGVESHDRFFGAAGMSLSYGEYHRLQIEMSDTTFVDASELIWKLRMVKSPMEQKCLRKACQITGKALQRTFQKARVGMMEGEVCQILIQTMMEEGADFPSPPGKKGPCAFIVMGASRRLGQLNAPTDKQLALGDLLRIDTGAIYKGYCADFARMGTVGPASPVQKETWQKVRLLIDQSLEVVKTGNRLGDIPVHWHGIGLDGVEAPFVGNHDGLLMEPGMVLALEEIIYSDSGETFHLEENVVVTKESYELLTEIDSQLYLIG